MLNVLTIQPALNDLYKLIEKVPKFPVSNRQLVEFASKARAPKSVVDFYRTFSDNRVYISRDELSAVSEQVDLMRQEEADMPREIERGPEEY
jgi:hypothetical protein